MVHDSFDWFEWICCTFCFPFNYPNGIYCKSPAPLSLPHLAVEKTAPFPVLLFFSTDCFQEHLKVLKSPAPVFRQFPSKLRLLQLFHFPHLSTVFLTLCKKDMAQEFWQGSSGLFLLRSFPGHSHMRLGTTLKDSPLLWAWIGCSKCCASHRWSCPSLLLHLTGFQAMAKQTVLSCCNCSYVTSSSAAAYKWAGKENGKHIFFTTVVLVCSCV